RWNGSSPTKSPGGDPGLRHLVRDRETTYGRLVGAFCVGRAAGALCIGDAAAGFFEVSGAIMCFDVSAIILDESAIIMCDVSADIELAGGCSAFLHAATVATSASAIARRF